MLILRFGDFEESTIKLKKLDEKYKGQGVELDLLLLLGEAIQQAGRRSGSVSGTLAIVDSREAIAALSAFACKSVPRRVLRLFETNHDRLNALQATLRRQQPIDMILHTGISKIIIKEFLDEYVFEFGGLVKLSARGHLLPQIA